MTIIDKKTRLVLKVTDNNMQSCAAKTKIQYKLGEWARPSIAESGILVFDNLCDLEHFAYYNPINTRVFICAGKYQMSLPDRRLQNGPQPWIEPKVKDIWLNNIIYDGCTSGWPAGTLAFQTICPLKEVYPRTQRKVLIELGF